MHERKNPVRRRGGKTKIFVGPIGFKELKEFYAINASDWAGPVNKINMGLFTEGLQLVSHKVNGL